jgi:hypothetical protein
MSNDATIVMICTSKLLVKFRLSGMIRLRTFLAKLPVRYIVQ